MARRHPLGVVALTFVTLGVYGLYWFYRTGAATAATGQDARPLLWLIGIFIPLVNVAVLWRYAHAVAAATDRTGGPLLFVLLLVFFPLGQYRVQADLNAAAGDAANPLAP